MIRLVVISDSPPTMTGYLDQPIVTIGSGASPTLDLCIQGESIQPTHIQILKIQSQYYVVNYANDPFATLNGQPFGKKALNHQDTIQIDNTLICFEQHPTSSVKTPIKACENPVVTPSPSSIIVDTQTILPILVERSMSDHAQRLEETTLSYFHESSVYHENEEYFFESNNEISEALTEAEWGEEEMAPFDLDDLFKQVEALAGQEPESSTTSMLSSKEDLNDNKQSEATAAPQKETDSPDASLLKTDTVAIDTETNEKPNNPELPVAHSKNLSKLSLKDYYLSEYDDVSESDSPNTQDNPHTLYRLLLTTKHWKLYFKIGLIVAIITSIAFGLTFLWMSDQTDKEEIMASKGVADVTMALTYAHINHIRPKNQNWSDPEFIKKNLTAVLPATLTPYADFDSHGQFANCPYFLRIYTSNDLSQFLVIAQPAPSLLQWLIPRSTIIIDSESMEMRKTNDLKSLNRLLANANTLDGTSAVEVSNLVRQGTVIPLMSLVNKNEQMGFSPPKALALIRPGAENLVYNAPRYFSLSEELIKKSLNLIEKPASSHEVTRLQQDLIALNKLPNAILYSSGGIQNAIHAQKALATLSPKEKFLIAYLQINSKGVVTNSHVLMDDTAQEVAISTKKKHSQSITTHATNELKYSDEAIESEADSASASSLKEPLPTEESTINKDDPLFLQFSALNVFRQHALKPLCEEMISLLKKETHSSQPSFESKFKQLLLTYTDADKEQQTKIQRKIDAIYHENTHIPASEFFSYAKIAGLQEVLTLYLNNLKQYTIESEFTKEAFDISLKKIETSQNWETLELELEKLIENLKLETVPNEENIINFQNMTRSTVIQKLNQMILSPDSVLPSQSFDSEYRYLLINILKMSWISDVDTFDFYLSEFDLRTRPKEEREEIEDNTALE